MMAIQSQTSTAMILSFWKKSAESTKVNSKLRQQFTMRVLGRSPRRKGCGENRIAG